MDATQQLQSYFPSDRTVGFVNQVAPIVAANGGVLHCPRPDPPYAIVQRGRAAPRRLVRARMPSATQASVPAVSHGQDDDESAEEDDGEDDGEGEAVGEDDDEGDAVDYEVLEV